MRRILLPFDDGHKEVHFESVNDYAICGHDLTGDADLGYSLGRETSNCVDCPDCLLVMRKCKQQRLRKDEKKT